MAEGNSRNGRCGPTASFGLKLCVAKIPPTRTSAATEVRRDVIDAPARDSDISRPGEAIYGYPESKEKPARSGNLARPSRPDGGRWSQSQSECSRQPASRVSTNSARPSTRRRQPRPAKKAER